MDELTPVEYRSRPSPGEPSDDVRQAARLVLAMLLSLATVGAIYTLAWPQRSARSEWNHGNGGRCASNLHQIGLAILLYQQDFGGRYPPAVADLLATEQIGAETFTCPSTDDTPATMPTMPTTKPVLPQIAAALAVPGHLSYAYRGRPDWAAVPGDAVVAYETPGAHGNGANILFGDGHVDFVDQPRAGRLIAAAAATTRPVSAASVP